MEPNGENTETTPGVAATTVDSKAATQQQLPEATAKKIADNKFLYSRSKYVFDYAMQEWYDPLKDYTLKTEFIPMHQVEITALYAACVDQLYKAGLSRDPRPEKTTLEDVKVLINLEAKIDATIQKFGGAAFAKLSTRSPKDALADKVNDRLRPVLEDELARNSDGSPNGDTCAFVQAVRRAFKVRTGSEVLQLFTASSRIREDLAKTLEFPEAFDMFIIIREWKDIEAEMEFRGFVHHRELNALSQYCYMQYWPDLTSLRGILSKRIVEFYNNSGLKEKLPYENCVVDFAVLRTPNQAPQVLIIELNPFFQDTSACLFDWKSTEDRKTIHEGPFEMRLVEAPVEDPLGCLSLDWRRFVEKYRGIEPKKRTNTPSAAGNNASNSPPGSSSQDSCVLM